MLRSLTCWQGKITFVEKFNFKEKVTFVEKFNLLARNPTVDEIPAPGVGRQHTSMNSLSLNRQISITFSKKYLILVTSVPDICYILSGEIPQKWWQECLQLPVVVVLVSHQEEALEEHLFVSCCQFLKKQFCLSSQTGSL